MNAVLVAVTLMLALSVARLHVMLSMIVAAFVGGWIAGMDVDATLKAFNAGIGGGAGIALSYALLGGFAVAISLSGLPHLLAKKILSLIGSGQTPSNKSTFLLRNALLLGLMLIAVSSQNIIPIHIAFIPILVPPLLLVMTRLDLDRRLVACVLTFGLVTPYMFLPIGFGNIYLNEILLSNVGSAGLDTETVSVVSAMAIPALGMLIGLLIAALFSYRKPRHYKLETDQAVVDQTDQEFSAKSLWVAGAAIVIAFVVQLYLGSMVLGAMAGFLLFSATGVIHWSESDGVLVDGMKMMASIGFIMIAASGFSEVIKATGHIDSLVNGASGWLGDNKALAALLLLIVGLVLTMGIGSSFSTIPIIAAIYVPLCMQLGFSPLAIVALVGTAGALGDAGSPASDSTLGPTAGLNADGQHNHMSDTVIPTFIHFNLPLLAAGWVAAMVL
ncbi:Na+/H+ antiporter family protein [Alkalimarinus alittae]|uniref:TRAP transporter large permease subunit n=1 Tax=Alkalimarinus alittae TaxID=2961619 RepID=A0ABY6MYA0_9ALTE|nr:Na+/H+ antiporter NhaC family protein [Alkalimarinus alittae]UZE94805.1 TRAP transporter large permease subunit [Alkalimarinus alittae]